MVEEAAGVEARVATMVAAEGGVASHVGKVAAVQVEVAMEEAVMVEG